MANPIDALPAWSKNVSCENQLINNNDSFSLNSRFLGQSNYNYSQLQQNLAVNPSLYHDVTEALGKVPLVRLNQIHPLCAEHNFYLKLESCNPGGSIKEKNAAYLVKQAEAQGLLRQGGTIIESSSGNFGIGLAIMGAVRGYRVMIVIDAKTSPTIRRMLTAYGAELVEVPASAADARCKLPEWKGLRNSQPRLMALGIPASTSIPTIWKRITGKLPPKLWQSVPKRPMPWSSV